MLVAMLTSNASPHCISLCTDGRTDVLTQMLVTYRGDIAFRNAREERQKVPCICIDQRESCPDNCFLRWF